MQTPIDRGLFPNMAEQKLNWKYTLSCLLRFIPGLVVHTSKTHRLRWSVWGSKPSLTKFPIIWAYLGLMVLCFFLICIIVWWLLAFVSFSTVIENDSLISALEATVTLSETGNNHFKLFGNSGLERGLNLSGVDQCNYLVTGDVPRQIQPFLEGKVEHNNFRIIIL